MIKVVTLGKPGSLARIVIISELLSSEEFWSLKSRSSGPKTIIQHPDETLKVRSADVLQKCRQCMYCVAKNTNPFRDHLPSDGIAYNNNNNNINLL